MESNLIHNMHLEREAEHFSSQSSLLLPPRLLP